jgi:hypothetical protein
MKSTLWLTAAAVLVTVGIPLRADVIFSNLTPVTTGGEIVDGSDFGPQSLAEAFTPASGATMTEAQVKGGVAGGLFNMSLFSNNNGVPGSSIATLGAGLTGPNTESIISVTGLSVALAAGTKYWLVLSPDDAALGMEWATGNGPGGPSYNSFSSGPWISNGINSTTQFEIDGTPLVATPEPSMLGIVAVMLGVIGWRFRKGRFATSLASK